MVFVLCLHGVKLVSWRATEFLNVSLKQGKMVRVLQFYSTSKNTGKKDVDSSLAGNEKRKTLLDRLGNGLNLGTWKFYMQDLVFKNLKPDIVPLSYKMCYRSGLETYANLAITTAVSAATCISAGLVYQLLQVDSAPLTEEIIGFGIAGVVSIIALMIVSLRVPLRIYYSPKSDDFLVFMPRFIPYATRKLCIQPGQLAPPTSTSGFLPWINIQHIHTESKQKILIDGDKFILPMYYNKLMGY